MNITGNTWVKLPFLLLLIYVGIVAAAESALGYFQPSSGNTLVITTEDLDGSEHDRVLARLELNNQLLVAVNHWPRAWYRRVLQNPSVQINLDGPRRDYLAIPVTEEEYQSLNDQFFLGFSFRLITGFPPRYFIRLEPV